MKRKYTVILSIAVAVSLMLVSSTQASIGLPDYDSDWVGIGTGTTVIHHNLNTTEVLVYMLGKDSQGYIHHNAYGGYVEENSHGAFWCQLDWDNITIVRNAADGEWVEVRVMMWKIETQPQGVGGFWIPVDKLGLLAPYIALVSTVILAVSITVAYIKHRKKQ